MLDDVLSDDTEMGIMVETAVYKHIMSFYQNAPSVNIDYYRKAKENQKEVYIVIELPKEKILCEVKYRNNPAIPSSDAIVSLSNEEDANVKHSFVVTKSLLDYGFTKHEIVIPIFKMPAIVFIYLLGRAEALDENRKI